MSKVVRWEITDHSRLDSVVQIFQAGSCQEEDLPLVCKACINEALANHAMPHCAAPGAKELGTNRVAELCLPFLIRNNLNRRSVGAIACASDVL